MYGTAGLAVAGIGMPMPAFAKVLGSNDRIRVGVIGFSDRFRQSLLPSFMACAEKLNFEIVAVSDIWKLRREEAVKHFKEKYGINVRAFRNNEELYDAKICDAVIISTADFQHSQHCIQAVKAGCDAYVEKRSLRQWRMHAQR